MKLCFQVECCFMKPLYKLPFKIQVVLSLPCSSCVDMSYKHKQCGAVSWLSLTQVVTTVQGSAEATSATWPERTLQHSSSVSGHGHALQGHPQLASGVVDRSSLPSAHQSNAAPFASHMWLPAGTLTRCSASMLYTCFTCSNCCA